MKIAPMIVPLRHASAEKSESTGGEQSIDFRKFFMKLCLDLDETIFEDDD